MKTGKNLVIVESPNKVKVIKEILGKDFCVMSSVGHVCDLPVKRMGVDIDKDFTPEYVTSTNGIKILQHIHRHCMK